MLAPGQTSEGAGFSASFVTGDARASVRASQMPPNAPPPSGEPLPDTSQADAVLAALAPRMAPWASVRVGIAGDNEAGIAYTGRAVRLDARHAFEDGSLAYSVGAGGSWVLQSRDDDAPGGATVSAKGAGFDVPILIGWRSTAGVVTLWAGARGGFESLTDASGSSVELGLKRWYGGGLVGLGLGFRHVFSRFELDTFYQGVTGTIAPRPGDRRDVEVKGVTVSPAAAVVVEF